VTRSEAEERLTKRLATVAGLRAVQSQSADDLIFERALRTAESRARAAAHAYETADSDED
jgi:hypothetical protein